MTRTTIRSEDITAGQVKSADLASDAVTPFDDDTGGHTILTAHDLVVALWEGVVEERMASVTRLEGLRQAIKQKYAKE